MKCGIGLYYCRSDLLTCIKLVKKTLELAGVMPFLYQVTLGIALRWSAEIGRITILLT